MEVSGQLHKTTALPPRESPPVPVEYDVGWVPESVWTVWKREKSCPCRESNPGRPASGQLLYRLSCPDSYTENGMKGYTSGWLTGNNEWKDRRRSYVMYVFMKGGECYERMRYAGVRIWPGYVVIYTTRLLTDCVLNLLYISCFLSSGV
jgi:hypothetical protein